MVLTIEDFLARRTRTALLDPQNGTVAAKHVATTIGNYFKWSHKEQLSHVSRYLLFAKEHQVDMT
jgi:glycerol-3-phosphate dehydrogenase